VVVVKSAIFRVGLFGYLFVFGLITGKPALAQVTSDGTLSTSTASPDGRNFTINGGDRAGSNLFHSFRDFSVPTGGSAVFNNATDVQNIFSRVTGGNISNIDGLIRANGSANLFLLNPNGILFGANASLNIGGSFLGTTADRIQFADGAEFSATNPSATPLLTMSVPIGLQMGQMPGMITVQNAGHRLIEGNTPLRLGKTPSGLRVASGETLALIGGDITLEGGILTAPSGHIELGSARAGTVTLTTTARGWDFDYSKSQQFSDIQFLRQSLANASGAPAGSIHLQGRNISVNQGSVALLINQSNQDPGDITVNASDSLEMRGVGTYGFAQSRVTADATTGTSGNLVITAPQLLLQDGGIINTHTFGSGTGGNISVVADSIQLSGFSALKPATAHSGIIADTRGVGRAGDIQVTTQQLRMQEGGSIASASFSTGATGNVVVNAAESIELTGETPVSFTASLIGAISFNRGSGGNVTVNTSRLSVQNGAGLAASTLGPGNAGTLRVNSEQISVSGTSAASGKPSNISASAPVLPLVFQRIANLPAFPTGNSGNLIINTSRLQVTDGATVRVNHQGVGNAGDLRLNADTISLDRAGSITASTRSGGGGNMNLRTHTLTMRHGSNVVAIASEAGNGGQVAIAADTLDLLGNSYISTQAEGAGNAGTLNLQVGQLTLNHGRIAVESQGTGDAGRLTINADVVQLDHRSVINASTQVGQGGDVQLQARDTLQLNDHSRIVADAQRSGRGGNVSITAADTVLRDRSRISTNAQGRAVGGALTIGGDRLSLFDSSQITASTAGTGSAGSLTIQANNAITLSGRNTRLAAASTTNAPAGSILLRSPQVRVSDRATISVSGQGRGGAGDLTIQANTIDLDRQGALEAEVAGGDRGNITLNADLLLMQRGSQITTNATGTAGGGNITLNTGFLIGLENSDIVAQAEQGSGGNIAIATQGLFGIEPRAALTTESDINASSQLGLNGTVNVTTLNVTPESGLVELPAEVVDSSQQIAATCAATQASRFVATGRGGIPENPTQELGSDRPWQDLRDLSSFTASVAKVPATDPASPVEAGNWRLNAQGQVELVAIASVPQLHRTETCATTSGE
jgi:filamentous hemagglutinin family protein